MKGQDEVREFLTQLFTDQDQFEIFTIIDDKHVSARYPKETPANLSTIDYDKLSRINGYAIYFTPNSMKGGKRSKATVDKFNTMFLDFDFKDHLDKGKADTISTLEGLQLPPSAIVETKNGIHAYWFLQAGTISDSETYEALQRAMQEKLGSDHQAIDCSHLMRLPGFKHWKDPKDPFDVKLISKRYDKRYTLDELAHKFGGKKKLKELKKKHQAGAYSNKPITPAAFSGRGHIDNIASQCRAFRNIESRRDLGHHERLALVWVYSNLGQTGIEHLMEVLEKQNDYDEEVSTSFINHSIKRGYKPPTCKWMQENGRVVENVSTLAATIAPLGCTMTRHRS
ncbi:MAG: DNA-primase RepB domain-containing protein [Candidatus Marinimicrobia bacterium]|nr:DNA-primase RepB domain-containing protein [Candidatus Neomarinimicrobiota bacterium]